MIFIRITENFSYYNNQNDLQIKLASLTQTIEKSQTQALIRQQEKRIFC